MFGPSCLGERVQGGGTWHDQASPRKIWGIGQLVGDGGLQEGGGAGMEAGLFHEALGKRVVGLGSW